MLYKILGGLLIFSIIFHILRIYSPVDIKKNEDALILAQKKFYAYCARKNIPFSDYKVDIGIKGSYGWAVKFTKSDLKSSYVYKVSLAELVKEILYRERDKNNLFPNEEITEDEKKIIIYRLAQKKLNTECQKKNIDCSSYQGQVMLKEYPVYWYITFNRDDINSSYTYKIDHKGILEEHCDLKEGFGSCPFFYLSRATLAQLKSNLF